MLSLSIFLWSLTLVSTVSALPGGRLAKYDLDSRNYELGSPTEQAKRAFVSGSTTCYYTCPPISGYTVAYYGQYFGAAYCHYQEGQEDGYCGYDFSTGAIFAPNVGGLDCPSQAAGPTCGSPPNGGFKKRSLNTKKTPAQDAVAKRQYKFKRTTSE